MSDQRPRVGGLTRHSPAPHAVTALLAIMLLAACGAATRPAATAPIPRALLREARPIGSGARFHPPATGRTIGRCRKQLGPRGEVHVELFAANRVVLVAAGIGTRPPRVLLGGRILHARCYGDLVTLDPTGVVLVRAGARTRLSGLFRSWGEPLSATRLASFSTAPGARVAVFVNGKRRLGPPGDVPLMPRSEIVLEVGPHVPPHASFTFPRGA